MYVCIIYLIYYEIYQREKERYISTIRVNICLLRI